MDEATQPTLESPLPRPDLEPWGPLDREVTLDPPRASASRLRRQRKLAPKPGGIALHDSRISEECGGSGSRSRAIAFAEEDDVGGGSVRARNVERHVRDARSATSALACSRRTSRPEVGEWRARAFRSPPECALAATFWRSGLWSFRNRAVRLPCVRCARGEASARGPAQRVLRVRRHQRGDA
jgi:hypothetical protein